jgi:aarF domain-containing kinase
MFAVAKGGANVAAKVFGASVLYSSFSGGLVSPWSPVHRVTIPTRLVACESLGFAAAPVVPLNLQMKRPEDRGIIFRIFRGMLRFGWILFKLSPCIVTLPLAVVGMPGSKLWWNYAIWALSSSGPTAVKFAQWAGTRPDLFPDVIVNALSRVHTESVHVYPLHKTESDLDRIYGPQWRDWLELTDDAKLIGSGAIAHVSRGRIIAGRWEGTDVALKIAHRGVRDIIEADLDIMTSICQLASHVPALTTLDLPAAIDEFGKFIRSQTDLLTEAENINKFRVNFRDQPKVKFPTVMMDKCTRDILVESFEPGVALGDIIRDGSTKLKKRVCDLGVSAFLKMLFVDNFVHGDLHPGNILFQPTNGVFNVSELNDTKNFEGNVVLIDCGLVAQLTPKDERNFIDLMHAVVTGQSIEVGRLMIERSRSPPETVYQPEVFCEKVASLVDTTVTGKSLLFGGLEFGYVIARLLAIACQHKVRLETDFVSVACALIVLEGVGKQLDPTRNLLWEAEPYILRQFIRRAKERFRS